MKTFCARLCSSSAPIVLAYRRQNSESFLEALVACFEYFGGVPRRVIFVNAKVAVKDGFGANAKATDGYAALAAHYGFEPVFCNVASGNEKGLVEGLVGFSRRNFLVPVPHVEGMEQLNNARPTYQGSVPDLSQYSTIFIGAPVWWGDWPMIMYTVFENEDLSGKTLIPFSTHEGSGLSGFDRKLSSACPDANNESFCRRSQQEGRIGSDNGRYRDM